MNIKVLHQTISRLKLLYKLKLSSHRAESRLCVCKTRRLNKLGLSCAKLRYSSVKLIQPNVTY